MKPNSCPLLHRRTLRLLVIAWLACLLAPITNAQIYTNKTEGSELFGVHRYDPFTGAFQSGFFANTTPGNNRLELSGNTLYALSQSFPTVSTYNATTGATLNSNFASAPNTWAQGQDTIAVSANGLFLGGTVFNNFQFDSVVAKYDATTGALNNASFVTISAGGSAPQLATAGNSLFLGYSGTVGSYNATTGAPISGSLITGLGASTQTVSTSIYDLAISGNNLFVTTQTFHIVGGNVTSADFKIGSYNATTGAATNGSLITLGGSISDTALLGNRLYVDYNDGTQQLLAVYDATTGASITPSLIATPGSYVAIGSVPEPTTLVLAAIGSVALLGRKTRRRLS